MLRQARIDNQDRTAGRLRHAVAGRSSVVLLEQRPRGGNTGRGIRAGELFCTRGDLRGNRQLIRRSGPCSQWRYLSR
jgi:hypothetical protein